MQLLKFLIKDFSRNSAEKLMVLLCSWEWSETILGNALCCELISTLLFVRDAVLASREPLSDSKRHNELLAKMLLA